MPSWKIHKKWDKRICNFYSEEIDRLIDNPQQHDAGWYEEDIFLEQIEYVASKYGRKGVECYLLHHLLDMLKDELVSMTSKYGEINLEYVERILEWLKPEPLRKVKRYDDIWSCLILKLKSELKEVVEDIILEEGFKKSLKKSRVNQFVALWVKWMLENLPPCILIDSVDRTLINSRALKAVWEYICSHEDTSLDEINTQIRKCIADYIKENNLYKIGLCSKECKSRLWKGKEWRQFIKSLEIPCSELKRIDI